jgi:L-aminopeptidase/D-esterase-like protein
MKFRTIDISAIEDFRLGNADSRAKGTGCTVIVCDKGAVGGVDVRGGAPATRETDLLRSENTVELIHAVVLSGGSVFGLEAASGTARELSSRGIGGEYFEMNVPVVCGASLFDLGVGDGKAFPDVEMGIEATRNAFRGAFKTGNCGAGTGATVGKANGIKYAMKSGLGSFACADDKLQVGAVAAVNAYGDVYNGAGNIIAGLRSRDGNSIYGTIRTLKERVSENSGSDSIVIIDTPESSNESTHDLDKSRRMTRIIQALNDEYRKTSSIPADKIDEALVYSSSKPEPAVDPEETKIPKAHIILPDEEPDTDGRSENIREFLDSVGGEPIDKVHSDNEAELIEDAPEMGYDIPFNTTLGCLITNAKLTKAQANKLASILHDAYARAIKPVHSTQDGDTVFVLASGRQEVNFDAFAALATDVMQYAIINSVTSAKAAYGLPSANEIKAE